MNAKQLIGVSLALLIVGCATTPKPDAALESARAEVHSAEANPNVATYAAVDMEAARKDLEIAEAAYVHHDGPGIVQPAYSASRSA
jgi:ribosomal protein S12 methylthiotransferase accessory factor YcaO